jgi:maleylacetate reductase
LADGSPADFTWVDGERLIRFGGGALSDGPGLLAARSFERYVLLTTGRTAGTADSLAEGAEAVLEVPPGPVPDAAAAVRAAVAARPLVALGGGRVIDSAKAIAGADGLRCAAVPTTLSGAEMTGFHRMPAGVEQFRLVRPAVVIAAPELMASQPVADRTASAMNALAHAIEALYAPLANPVSELAALRACELIANGADGSEPDREALALGALLAGYASGAAGFAVHHAVCQTIVHVAGTPHARTNAVMLPHFVRMMEGRAPEQIAKVAAAIGAKGGADSAAERVAALARPVGVSGLSGLGVDASRLDEIVAAALAHPALANTPQPPGEDELRLVLEAAL